MYETHTYDDPDILPNVARNHWDFMETNSASAVLKSVCPREWADIVAVLSNYRLKPNSWLSPGGNRGDVAAQIDGAFSELGWREARLDLKTTGYLFDKDGYQIDEMNAVYQEGYLVDNLKGRVALDVEWNAKDGNIDRDLASYRSWHEAGLISAGVIITKDRKPLLDLARRLWANYQSTLPEGSRSSKLPVDLSTSTTTSFDKFQLRVRRGVMGTCPVLIVGANQSTWDKSEYIDA